MFDSLFPIRGTRSVENTLTINTLLVFRHLPREGHAHSRPFVTTIVHGLLKTKLSGYHHLYVVNGRIEGHIVGGLYRALTDACGDNVPHLFHQRCYISSIIYC